LSPEAVEHLQWGSVMFDANFHLTVLEGRALWKKHGADLLLESWIDRYPGSRPWGWWLQALETTGPRRQLRDGPRALSAPTWFGTPGLFADVPPEGLFESETHYLMRHRLLGETELRLIETATGAAPGRPAGAKRP
jgi:hypothetical protein